MSDQRGKKRRRADTEPTRDLPSAFNNVSKYPLRASGSDQLFDVFIKRGAYWTIFDRITSFLPIGDIHVLRRTCQAAAPIYDELLKSQWNIDNRLRRFFKNPTGFREVLGECDAVISGSFALQFFERVLWKESDLDIFVRHIESHHLLRYITTLEGYELESSAHKDENGYPVTMDIEVFTYVRSANDPRNSRKVQIISTMDIPVASILETFYTTALLNVITWNKAYAVFPQPTFLHHKTFLLKSLTDYYGPLLGKLTSRGWKTYPTLSLDEEDGIRDAWLRRTDVGGGSEICRRRFGDKSSWIIPLPTYEIKWPDMPDSVLAYSEFEIMTEDAHTASPDLDLHVSRYHIFCPIFKSLVLRHQYIYCTVILELGDRLEALTRLELLKMKPSERPADLTQRNTFSSGRLWESTFDRPESWTYYDEDLIEWIDRAESKFCRVVKTIRDHESESEP